MSDMIRPLIAGPEIVDKAIMDCERKVDGGHTIIYSGALNPYTTYPRQSPPLPSHSYTRKLANQCLNVTLSKSLA